MPTSQGECAQSHAGDLAGLHALLLLHPDLLGLARPSATRSDICTRGHAYLSKHLEEGRTWPAETVPVHKRPAPNEKRSGSLTPTKNACSQKCLSKTQIGEYSERLAHDVGDRCSLESTDNRRMTPRLSIIFPRSKRLFDLPACVTLAV